MCKKDIKPEIYKELEGIWVGSETSSWFRSWIVYFWGETLRVKVTAEGMKLFSIFAQEEDMDEVIQELSDRDSQAIILIAQQVRNILKEHK